MIQRSEKHDDSNSEDRGTKESTFLFAKIPTTLRHNRKWYFRYLVPLIIASSMLVWTYPYSNVIYGMDSFNFFLFPLNPVSSPLNLAAGSSAGFYITVFEYILGRFLLPSAVEHVLIFVALFIGVFGIFRLFETYNELNGLPAEAYVVPKTIAALLYVANPFTLTVVLWHFEGWSLFILVVPFILSLIFEILYAKELRLETFLLSGIVCVILSPGVLGPYAISILYISTIASLYIFFNLLRKKDTLLQSMRRLLMIVTFVALILLWINFPAYLVNFIGSAAGSYSPGIFFTHFIYNSSYAQINNILSLTAFNWIYNYPLAYGWPYSYNSVLIYAGYVLFSIFFFSAIVTRSSKITRFSVIAIIPFLIISTGSNYPFFSLNTFLLNLGGPFLIVTNSFYFMGQIYVVLMISVIYLAAVNLQSRLKEGINVPESLYRCPKKNQILLTYHRKSVKKGKRMQIVAALFFAIILGLSAVFWTPLVLNEEYQTQHSQIDEFKLPQNMLQMSTFFKTNYTFPNYYALILPMSNEEGYTMSFDNASFVDSVSLFSSLIPYPVISMNHSLFEQELNDFLSGGQYDNLVPVFQSLHIRYIVFNPYHSSSDQGLEYAQNNMKINQNLIYEKLTSEVGSPTSFGSIHIFTVPNCIPLAYGSSQIGYVSSSDYQTYLGFLSSLSSKDEGLLSGITSYVWTNSDKNIPINETQSISIHSYNGQIESYPVKQDTTILGMGERGQVSNISSALLTANNTDYLLTGNELTVNSPVIYSMAVDGNYSTDLRSGNGLRVFSRNSSGWINFTNTGEVDSSFLMDFKMNLDSFALIDRSQLGINVNSGNYTLRLSFNGELNSPLLFFNESAHFKGYKYAWASQIIPISTLETCHDILLYIYNDSLDLVLTNNNSTTGAFSSPDFYYSPSEYNENPGYNSTALPTTESTLDMNNSTVQLWTHGLNGSIQNMIVREELPIKYILFEHGMVSNSSPNLTFSYNYEGDISAHFSNDSQNESLYIILSCPNPSKWVVLGNSSMTSELYPSTFQSVFLIDNAQARNHVQIGLGGYAHLINIGLFVSIIELVVMVSLLVTRLIRKI